MDQSTESFDEFCHVVQTEIYMGRLAKIKTSGRNVRAWANRAFSDVNSKFASCVYGPLAIIAVRAVSRTTEAEDSGGGSGGGCQQQIVSLQYLRSSINAARTADTPSISPTH